MSVRSIPTTYRSTRFRSRLEARWACFFDLIGWRWTYEPFDAGGYIPDFLIHGDRPFVVEVKPAANYKELEQHLDKVAKAQREALVVGVSPVIADGPYPLDWPLAGIALQNYADTGPPELIPANALWHRCGQCEQIAIHHEMGGFYGYPCDHYEGDHYLHHISDQPAETLLEAWASCTNATQWRK